MRRGTVAVWAASLGLPRIPRFVAPGLTRLLRVTSTKASPENGARHFSCSRATKKSADIKADKSMDCAERPRLQTQINGAFGPRKSAILRHFLKTPPGFVRRLIGPIERVGAIGRTGPSRPTGTETRTGTETTTQPVSGCRESKSRWHHANLLRPCFRPENRDVAGPSFAHRQRIQVVRGLRGVAGNEAGSPARHEAVVIQTVLPFPRFLGVYCVLGHHRPSGDMQNASICDCYYNGYGIDWPCRRRAPTQCRLAARGK